MKKLTIVLVAVLALFANFSAPAMAKLGVGVGSGKIVVTQDLRSGVIYDLPVLAVINTGDEESEYKVGVSYHENQSEIKPDASWFKFSPEKFTLKPGEVQNVKISLNLPLKTVPGDYFAYLEASPLKKSEQGGASVGIAAAAKLYFKVVPSNFISGIYYRLTSLWIKYSPWTDRAMYLVIFIIAALLFKNYFNIEIKSRKKEVKE